MDFQNVPQNHKKWQTFDFQNVPQNRKKWQTFDFQIHKTNKRARQSRLKREKLIEPSVEGCKRGLHAERLQKNNLKPPSVTLATA